MFSFEALRAGHGDALVVHWGPEDAPEMMIVDGGPHDVFEDALKPRLEEMISFRGFQPLAARLVMVSHIDDDHITGVLDLLEHVEHSSSPLVTVQSLWHNSFDGSIQTDELAALADLGSVTPAGAATVGTNEWIISIAAGVSAGRSLRNKASQLGLVVNAGGSMPGFISEGDSTNMGNGLKLRVLNPDRGQLSGLQMKWDGVADRLSQLSQEERRTVLARIVDESLANISSLVVHLERNGKTMLLTGDARGDNIESGLRRAGLMNGDTAKVDILKVPHHGSDRNVSTDFFRKVKADHYVFSGDRTVGNNPDTATLEMLTTARGSSRYTMHFTYRRAAITNWIDRDTDQNSRNYDVEFASSSQHGLWIDLEEDLWF